MPPLIFLITVIKKNYTKRAHKKKREIAGSDKCQLFKTCRHFSCIVGTFVIRKPSFLSDENFVFI